MISEFFLSDFLFLSSVLSPSRFAVKIFDNSSIEIYLIGAVFFKSLGYSLSLSLFDINELSEKALRNPLVSGVWGIFASVIVKLLS